MDFDETDMMIYGEDEEFMFFLKELIAADMIENETALGITKQVIGKGYESLSETQKAVFRELVLREFVINNCERCGSVIEWDEMMEAIANEELCEYCVARQEKLMEE